MIAGHDRCHACPDFTHDPRALMTEDRGEQPFAIKAVQRVGIGMADARRHNLDEHLAGLWPFKIEFDDFERLLDFEGNGGAGPHELSVL